jgi:uncharacterized membrane protein YwzB
MRKFWKTILFLAIIFLAINLITVDDFNDNKQIKVTFSILILIVTTVILLYQKSRK